MSEKILKLHHEVGFSVYDLEGDIDKAIDYLGKLRDDALFSTVVEARIKVEPYGYDGGVELSVCYYRHETDEEEAKRVEAEAKIKAKAKAARLKKEERERAEYERLKAKFG